MDADRFQDDLRRYWDEIARGGPATPGALDPELAATIRRLHTVPDVPPPDPVIARRRREDLMHATAVPLTLPPSAAPSRNGQRPPPLTPVRQASAMPRRVPSGGFSALGTVLLLLVTVAMIVIASGRLPRTPTERAAVVPLALASPSPAATSETLFATTLPAAMLPSAAGARTFDAWHAVLDPGARVPIAAQLPGPQITHVVAGELTLRVDGPLQVFRGAGGTASPAAIPASTEVVLHPGDTAVYAYDTSATYANRGASPVDLVGGELAVGAVPGAAVPLSFIDYGEQYPLPAFPPGPVQVTIAQATVPPKESLPAPPAGGRGLALGVREDVNLGETGTGALRNISPREVAVYVVTFAPAAASGTPPA